MKLLMFILPLFIGVISYPDVSELTGYNYNKPSANQLTQPSSQPTGSYIPPSSGSNGYNYNNPSHNKAESTHQPSTNYLPARGSQLSGSYIPPAGGSNGYNYNGPALQPSTTYLPTRNSHNSQPTGSYIPPAHNQPSGSGSYISPSISNNHQPSGSYLPSDQHSANLVRNQDQKHVYYFAAPDEEEQTRFRINIAPSTQKNTRIIFVKTPNYGNVVPEVIAPPSQAEDKTLVYVLVKKSQQDNSITIPASTGVKQAKPEVYFIKYKNQHEAQRAVSESLEGRSAGSNLPDLGNEQEFVKSLKDSLQKSGKLEDFSGSSSSQFGTGGYEDSSNLLSGASLNNNYGPPGSSGPY